MGKIQKMVDYALLIARDDSHGYSQRRRWPSQGDDFDCSSFMYYCANQAGYDVPLSGYTGTMLPDFKKAGFTAVPFDGNLDDLDPGDIMLNVENHTEMYVGNGQFVGAHIAETGDVDGAPGDQTGDEISICDAYIPKCGWDYVLVPPAENSQQTDVKPTASTSARLYGIDVSGSKNQPADICRRVVYDFAIVKMSGNPPKDGQGRPLSWNYVNPDAKQQAADAYKKTGLLGLYHFGWGKQADVEAEFFIEQVKKLGYLGKAMLVLDYENSCTERGQTWVYKFVKRVEELVGYKPVIYASGSVITSQNLFSLGCPIWCASYYKGYEEIDGYDTSGMKIYPGCEKSIMWQFTSEGYLSGYDGRLDLNVFFGGKADFQALMGSQSAASAKPAQQEKPQDDSVVFRVSTDPRGKKWSPEGKCNGNGIRWLAVKGVGKYRVHTQDNGWLPWVDEYDCSDLEYGCAGDGSPITGVEIPSNEYRYAVRVLGGVWYPDMIGNTDTGGSDDTYAGDLSCGIDGFRISRA